MKQTPLVGEHRDRGAHLTEFGGWEMPLRYGSEKTEHQAVREAAGIFDLSHMGEIWVTGSQAGEALDACLVGKLSKMRVGKAKYGLIVDETGHLLDDLITYRLGDDRYLVVPNAANADAVLAAVQQRCASFDAVVTDATRDTALIAVQGPASEDIVAALVGADADAVRALGYYAIHECADGLLVARTGYTGEDGFELIGPNERAVSLWTTALKVGADAGLIPCGLAARDSLRLEAGMPLFGHELTTKLTPFDAGFGRMIAFDTDFCGRDALEQIKDSQPTRALVGLKGNTARPARADYEVFAGGKPIGIVTSAIVSPTLGYPIAMAYLGTGFAEPGTTVEVDVRGRKLPFEVVTLPFYSRTKPGGN